MADFTTIKFQFNSNTDASPTWQDMLLGTSNYGFRYCAASAGGASIASASWPIYPGPASVGVVPECWGYVGSDNSGGIKQATYDGTSAHYMQVRVSWDNLGTFASAPIVSAWKDNTYPAASPGTQPGTGDGSAIINGHATDTGSASYFKAAIYGFGVTSGGTQQTPGSNSGGTVTATTGSAGAVTSTSAAWSSWQSLQAATQYLQDGATPAATTAGLLYMLSSLWAGPNLRAGTLTPVWGFQYSWV